MCSRCARNATAPLDAHADAGTNQRTDSGESVYHDMQQPSASAESMYFDADDAEEDDAIEAARRAEQLEQEREDDAREAAAHKKIQLEAEATVVREQARLWRQSQAQKRAEQLQQERMQQERANQERASQEQVARRNKNIASQERATQERASTRHRQPPAHLPGRDPERETAVRKGWGCRVEERAKQERAKQARSKQERAKQEQAAKAQQAREQEARDRTARTMVDLAINEQQSREQEARDRAARKKEIQIQKAQQKAEDAAQAGLVRASQPGVKAAKRGLTAALQKRAEQQVADAKGCLPKETSVRTTATAPTVQSAQLLPPGLFSQPPAGVVPQHQAPATTPEQKGVKEQPRVPPGPEQKGVKEQPLVPPGLASLSESTVPNPVNGQSHTNYIKSKSRDIWIRGVFINRIPAPWVLGPKHVSNPAYRRLNLSGFIIYFFFTGAAPDTLLGGVAVSLARLKGRTIGKYP